MKNFNGFLNITKEQYETLIEVLTDEQNNLEEYIKRYFERLDISKRGTKLVYVVDLLNLLGVSARIDSEVMEILINQ